MVDINEGPKVAICCISAPVSGVARVKCAVCAMHLNIGSKRILNYPRM